MEESKKPKEAEIFEIVEKIDKDCMKAMENMVARSTLQEDESATNLFETCLAKHSAFLEGRRVLALMLEVV